MRSGVVERRLGGEKSPWYCSLRIGMDRCNPEISGHTNGCLGVDGGS